MAEKDKLFLADRQAKCHGCYGSNFNIHQGIDGQFYAVCCACRRNHILAVVERK